MAFEFQDSPTGSANEPNNSSNTNNQTRQPTSEPQNPNITQDNIDITNPFAEPKIKEGDVEANKQQQVNNQQQPQLSFADIVKQKQFGSLPKDLFDKANEGDIDSFNSGLQGMMQQVYKTAIEDSNRLMTARMQDFEQKLMTKLNNSKEADGLVNELKTAIPYAQDAAVEPVARQVLSGYLRQGMSKNEAIAATNAYFGRLADKVGQANEPKSRQTGILKGKAALDELFN